MLNKWVNKKSGSLYNNNNTKTETRPWNANGPSEPLVHPGSAPRWPSGSGGKSLPLCTPKVLRLSPVVVSWFPEQGFEPRQVGKGR